MEKEKREELFKENEKLVYFVYNKYFNKNTNKDDLIQQGFCALLKAIDSFNYEKGIQFSTYAVRCILNELCNYTMNDKIIRIPNVRANKDISLNIISINMPVTDTEDKDITLQDQIEGSNDIEDYINYNHCIEKIRHYLDTIPNEKHKQLFTEYLQNRVENKTKSRNDLVEKYKLSKCYVNMIIAEHLYKLRRELQHESR